MIAQQIINGLMLGSIYVLVAVSFTLTMGVLNFLNFSIPAVFMVGGFVTWVALSMGFYWPLAVIAGIVTAGLSSFLVERFTYQWMKDSDHEVPLVSSLGFLLLFENLVLIGWGSDLQAFPSIVPDFNIRAFGFVIGIGQLISLSVSLLVVFLLARLLKKTQLGRGIRAVAENAQTAELLGIEVRKIVPILFISTGVLAGLAGVLFGVNYLQVSPFMGEDVGLKGIAAMVIGGMGNVWGSVAGGLLIGLVEVLSIHFGGADMVDVSVYGLLMVILVVRPQGLFGGTGAAKEKL